MKSDEKSIMISGLGDLKKRYDEISSKTFDKVIFFMKKNPDLIARKNPNGTFGNLCEAIHGTRLSLEIDFRDNCLGDFMVETILRILQNNRSVQTLILWMPFNKFSDQGVKQMFDEIRSMVSVKKLLVNFEWNFDLTARSLENLCLVLRMMPNLEDVSVRMTKYTQVKENSEELFRNTLLDLKKLKRASYNNKFINIS